MDNLQDPLVLSDCLPPWEKMSDPASDRVAVCIEGYTKEVLWLLQLKGQGTELLCDPVDHTVCGYHGLGHKKADRKASCRERV